MQTYSGALDRDFNTRECHHYIDEARAYVREVDRISADHHSDLAMLWLVMPLALRNVVQTASPASGFLVVYSKISRSLASSRE